MEPFLTGGGVTGALLRSVDWSTTPLGAIRDWPTSLKTAVGIVLHSRNPMFLFWGPELIQIYNDAYMPSFGRGKHPAAMGQRGRECWKEIWPIIGPQIEDVMLRGKSTWHEDALVPIFRNNRVEDVYWTYGYSPVFREDGAVGGTLVVCTETTGRVLSERRRKAAHAMVTRTATEEVEGVLSRALEALVAESDDVAYAVAYRMEPESTCVVRTHTFGMEDAVRDRIEPVIRGRVEALAARGLESEGPSEDGEGDPAARAFIAEIPRRAQKDARRFVAYGLHPRLSFDALYREFLWRRTEHIAAIEEREDAFRVRDMAESERNTLMDRARKTYAERAALLTELEDASRAKDEFLAMLGHELRNPLSPIVTAVRLMKARDHAADSRELRVIERQVDHLVRLVDDLLDVSKITRGKVNLQREHVELYEVLAKAIEIASSLFEQRAQRLTIEVPREGLRWYGDPVRLAQVVANLLTNAARYTPVGGSVWLRAMREDDMLVIRVKDDGQGIDPALLPRIFDLFVQGRRGAEREQGGLGLGLALVRNLVSLHDGTVTAHSDGPGRGSEFVIRLPAASGLSERSTPAPQTAISRSAIARRVLVVDDNVDAAEMLGEVLGSVGHEVAIEHDPLAALATLERFRPEVAILDIGMPVMDGYELAAKMRGTEAGGPCRFIALTGYGQEHDHARSHSAGFERHLVKPIDAAHLLRILDGSSLDAPDPTS